MKKLLIVYAKNRYEILNRKSAIGSYIFCLAEILNKNCDVYINGISIETIKQINTIAPSRIKSKAIRIPLFFKLFVKDLISIYQIVLLYFKINEKEIKYDAIIEFYTLYSFIGLNLSKRQKTPLIFVFDGPILEEYKYFNGRNPIFKRYAIYLQKKSLRRSKKVIAYSASVKNYISAQFRINLEKIEIHQNIDFTRFRFYPIYEDNSSINIGFIGSFLKWHRVDLLIKAFQVLKIQNYPVTLYLIGHGMEYDSIKKVIDTNNIQDVIMPGFLDGDALEEYKKIIHIGVMPSSNWYGAPNKLFEYGAAHMAVVAPKTPTISDIFVDSENIILFENNSYEDLLSKLTILCDNTVLRRNIADNLFEKIKLEHSCDNTLNFYNTLI